MSEHQGSPGPDHDSPVVHEVSRPRHNGWSCPWHPFQFIAWFFILLFTVAHYGILAFYVPGLWRIAAYAVSLLAFWIDFTISVCGCFLELLRNYLVSFFVVVILLPTVYHSIDLTLVQIPGIVLLVHIIANIVTTSINPAEPAVLRKLQSGRRLRPIFDRSVHKHVIEDRHCHLCEIDV